MKARVTLTQTIEYEIRPENYSGMEADTPSPETCLEQDLTQFRDDPDAFWELADSKTISFEINGEVVP